MIRKHLSIMAPLISLIFLLAIFFQQPHFCIFDGQTEERVIFMAEDVIVNIDRSASSVVDHVDRCNAVRVRSRKKNLVDDFRMIGKIAKEHAKVLHHII